ncbi:MAG: uroporphyrinogen-III synthase [Planctomycetota bacterium]
MSKGQEPRLLITGPVRSLNEWSAAARSAGFDPIEHALVQIEERPLDAELVPSNTTLLCITSANALPSLAQLVQAHPEWAQLPLRCVGTRTAEKARKLGFSVVAEAAEDAASLAAQVLRAKVSGAVLWPRGSRSRELHDALTEGGVVVHDPVAYASVDAPPTGPLPDAQAVFFASPSAVHVYLAAEHERPIDQTVAIAIGSTTAEALRSTPFLALASLPHPAPDALTWRLDHLGFELPS